MTFQLYQDDLCALIQRSAYSLMKKDEEGLVSFYTASQPGIEGWRGRAEKRQNVYDIAICEHI